MWAMWANILKNFVCGPSAAVTFGARPYPGALSQKAKSHGAPMLTILTVYYFSGGQCGQCPHDPVARWP